MTILTVQEAAAFLKVTARTIYRHKTIPRTMVGGRPRFVKEDLEAWLRRSSGATAEGTPPRRVQHRNPIFGA